VEILETVPVPPPAVPPSSQVTAGRIIGRTFSVWTENLVAFSVVVLVLYLPVLALQLWLGPALRQDEFASSRFFRYMGGMVGAGLLGWFLGVVSMGALTYGVLQSLDGHRKSAGALLGFGPHRFWPVFVTSLNAGVRIALWSFLLVVPGIFAAFRLFVAVPVQVAEPELGSNAAVARPRPAVGEGGR